MKRLQIDDIGLYKGYYVKITEVCEDHLKVTSDCEIFIKNYKPDIAGWLPSKKGEVCFDEFIKCKLK